MRVRLTEPAEFDLERLADAIALIDPPRAKLFVEQLKVAARDIGRAPYRCPSVAANPQVRKKSVSPYLMLFEVRDNHVLILRIVHERSDWASLA